MTAKARLSLDGTPLFRHLSSQLPEGAPLKQSPLNAKIPASKCAKRFATIYPVVRR